MAFINYAHRGAPAYCPENTMLSFYTGMYMGANGIETDVQKTRDGVLVLFHDDTLNRILGIDGTIADFTYEELLQYKVKNGELSDIIPTFDDFLAHFKSFDITFAIELKVTGIEREVRDAIYKWGVQDKVVVTSFIFDAIAEMKRVAPELRVGFLTKLFRDPAIDSIVTDASEEVIKKLLDMGAYEICPKGSDITAERVAYWHSLGLGVRAWGISDTDVMKRVYEAGVDGMTVNFPDKLTELLKSN